jgi:iron complex outermembrane receptor protein
MLMYVKYVRGYRAGGVATDAPPGFNIFRPERVNTYETGIKTSFRGDSTGFETTALGLPRMYGVRLRYSW